MTHPVDGFLAVEAFPTIAAVNKWLDKFLPRYQPPPEHRKFLPAPPEPEISAEDRAAGAAELKRLAEELRARRREADRRRFGLKPLTFEQAHMPERLMEALAGGREMSGPEPKKEAKC